MDILSAAVELREMEKTTPLDLRKVMDEQIPQMSSINVMVELCKTAPNKLVDIIFDGNLYESITAREWMNLFNKRCLYNKYFELESMLELETTGVKKNFSNSVRITREINKVIQFCETPEEEWSVIKQRAKQDFLAKKVATNLVSLSVGKKTRRADAPAESSVGKKTRRTDAPAENSVGKKTRRADAPAES